MKKYFELDADVKRLEGEVEKMRDKVTQLTNEKIELFRRWTNGETFEKWQAEQKRNQEIEKEAAKLRSRLANSQVHREPVV